ETFQRWFAAIELIHADETHLTLRVPNNIYQLWIESNYMPLVQTAIISVLNAPRELKFVVAKETDEPVEPKDASVPRPKKSGSGSRENSEHEPPLDPSAASASGTNHGMNSRNTFESFVVGANNQYG